MQRDRESHGIYTVLATTHTQDRAIKNDSMNVPCSVRYIHGKAQTCISLFLDQLLVLDLVTIVVVHVTYHSSNWSDELKTSGNKKLSNAQSSCKLFCKGVPVSKSRCCVASIRTTVENCEFSFLIRWASSMTKNLDTDIYIYSKRRGFFFHYSYRLL